MQAENLYKIVLRFSFVVLIFFLVLNNMVIAEKQHNCYILKPIISRNIQVKKKSIMENFFANYCIIEQNRSNSFSIQLESTNVDRDSLFEKMYFQGNNSNHQNNYYLFPVVNINKKTCDIDYYICDSKGIIELISISIQNDNEELLIKNLNTSLDNALNYLAQTGNDISHSNDLLNDLFYEMLPYYSKYLHNKGLSPVQNNTVYTTTSDNLKDYIKLLSKAPYKSSLNELLEKKVIALERPLTKTAHGSSNNSKVISYNKDQIRNARYWNKYPNSLNLLKAYVGLFRYRRNGPTFKEIDTLSALGERLFKCSDTLDLTFREKRLYRKYKVDFDSLVTNILVQIEIEKNKQGILEDAIATEKTDPKLALAKYFFLLKYYHIDTAYHKIENLLSSIEKAKPKAKPKRFFNSNSSLLNDPVKLDSILNRFNETLLSDLNTSNLFLGLTRSVVEVKRTSQKVIELNFIPFSIKKNELSSNLDFSRYKLGKSTFNGYEKMMNVFMTDLLEFINNYPDLFSSHPISLSITGTADCTPYNGNLIVEGDIEMELAKTNICYAFNSNKAKQFCNTIKHLFNSNSDDKNGLLAYLRAYNIMREFLHNNRFNKLLRSNDINAIVYDYKGCKFRYTNLTFKIALGK